MWLRYGLRNQPFGWCQRQIESGGGVAVASVDVVLADQAVKVGTKGGIEYDPATRAACDAAAITALKLPGNGMLTVSKQHRDTALMQFPCWNQTGSMLLPYCLQAVCILFAGRLHTVCRPLCILFAYCLQAVCILFAYCLHTVCGAETEITTHLAG
jgi:hypothetical protein